MPLTKDVDIDTLAKKTENYSGADIEAVCREAAMLALRENMKAKNVSMEHFEKSLLEQKPSIAKAEIDKYIAALASAKKPLMSQHIPNYMS